MKNPKIVPSAKSLAHSLKLTIPTKTSLQSANNALNIIRSGPVKPKNDLIPKLKNNTEDKNKANITQFSKKIIKTTNARKRPASPGIRGKVALSPYAIYANSLKSSSFILENF